MEFSEKLGRLQALTQTQSIQLAKSIHLDPAQISRMKKGIRKRPNDPKLMQAIANFFAAHCTSDYQLSALAELSGDSRLTKECSQPLFGEIIFNWLWADGAENPSIRTPMGRFLQRIDTVSLDGSVQEGQENWLSKRRGTNALVGLYQNEGKRQAVLELLDIALACQQPGALYLFSDEDCTWLTEDLPFSRTLTKKALQLSQAGWRFYRVRTQTQDLDSAIRAIEIWLPSFVLGTVELFYYPHLRDHLHRCTVFVLPGKAAVISRSLAGETQSRISLFCEDPYMVQTHEQEVKTILARCLPMTRVYTTEDTQQVFELLSDLTAAPADGIYKTVSLSVPTMPSEIVERIYAEHASPVIAQMLANLRQRHTQRQAVLQEHRVVDMMALADLETILAGRVVIPNTRMVPGGPMYYTPHEYQLHLRSILAAMEDSENYQVVLTENQSWRDLILYYKEGHSVVIIKDNAPYAVFEITGPQLSAALGDFMGQLVAQESAKSDRRQTMQKLSELANRLP